MPIKILNTLTGKKEAFVPIRKDRVTMYVCGPTVYSNSHIGHARSAVCFDVIARYLRYSGYNLIYARNYTDVDDKIINRANEEEVTSDVIAERYIKSFDADMTALGVETPNIRPKATETIKEIIDMTQKLIATGAAYASPNGDVFFSVRKKDDYGKLSGKNIDELESGARVDVNESKTDPLDFALWKASKPGEPSWESPWGPGRPGWHIECSAMCVKHLDTAIDIHGGGRDLIFPHHENEIAQSEAATGVAPYVKYWLHNGFVNIEKEKMSKSLGNILNICDVIRDNTSEAIRLFLLSSHYRSPIDYSEDSLKDAEAAMERFYKTIRRIRDEAPDAASQQISDAEKIAAIKPIVEAMDDDFNTAFVVGHVFKEISNANRALDETKSGRRPDLKTLALSMRIFSEAAKFMGIFGKSADEYFKDRNSRAAMPTEEIERLIKERNDARKARDFKRADEIKKILGDSGIRLEDGVKGTIYVSGDIKVTSRVTGDITVVKKNE